MQSVVGGLLGSLPPQSFARSGIERLCYSREVVCAVEAQICAFQNVLAQEPISIFVCPSLPWASRPTERDARPRFQVQLFMLTHFCTLIPSQGARSWGGTPAECGQGRQRLPLGRLEGPRAPDLSCD